MIRTIHYLHFSVHFNSVEAYVGHLSNGLKLNFSTSLTDFSKLVNVDRISKSSDCITFERIVRGTRRSTKKHNLRGT